MQIYIDTFSDSRLYWEIFVDPTISLDSRGVTINRKFYNYVKIPRISINGNTKIFREAFVWANRNDAIPEDAKEILTSKNLSIPAMTFLVENLAPKCIESLAEDPEEIPLIDLKKYAKSMALRLIRDSRK